MNEERSPTDAVVAGDELVAYLDGELSRDEEAVVIRRLTEDPAYQQRLAQLQRAWDLLDVLHKAEPDAEFTRSTVEMVAVQQEKEAERAHESLLRRRLGWWIVGGLAVALLVAGGFSYVQSKLSEPERQFLRDYPVIQRVDQYRNAESVEFLERLRKEGLFPGEGEDAI
jgi:anti-sigma factor RsiW